MAASPGPLPYKAPCSATAALGHRMLSRRRPEGARAKGAGPAGRGRGARRGCHCARRRCSFGSRSAPGAPGRGRARAGARGIPGHGSRSPRAPPRTPVKPGAAHAARDVGGRGCRVPPSPRRPGPGCTWEAAWVAVAVAGGWARGSQVHLGRVGGLSGACRERWAVGGRSRPGGVGGVVCGRCGWGVGPEGTGWGCTEPSGRRPAAADSVV